MDGVKNIVETPDEFAKTRWKAKRRSKERELHVFYQSRFQLEAIVSMHENLHTLVIVGQSEVNSVEPIAMLKHLKELWIVECSLKNANALKMNQKLEKLYLYGNEIQEIPDLADTRSLKIFSLARNKIFDIANVREMRNLQDLNLGDNDIETIPNIFSAGFELLHLNLSANPLHHLHGIENLVGLTKLQSIEFGDPVYGECPLVSLCNYRPYLIRRLPNLREIDHYPIGLQERFDTTINEFSFHNKMWKRYLNNGLLNSSIFMKIFSSDELLRIKMLTITNCSIIEANFEGFFLPHLESLDLSKNKIHSLRGLGSLKKLRTLCISHNRIGDSDEDELSSSHSNVQICPGLIALYADHNRISSIGKAGFPVMPSLKYIFLQRNKLNDINGIQDFPSLNTAILDHNRIESISENLFKSNKYLRCLMLENNKLTSLNFTTHLPKLEKLFAANNNITDESNLNNLSTLTDLKELTILGNPFCKSCNHYLKITEMVKSIEMIDGHWMNPNFVKAVK